MSINLQQVSTTTDLATGKCFLFSVTLTADVGIASVEIRDGELGPVRLQLRTGANNTTVWRAASPSGVLFATTVHVTVGGAGSYAALEYEVVPS